MYATEPTSPPLSPLPRLATSHSTPLPVSHGPRRKRPKEHLRRLSKHTDSSERSMPSPISSVFSLPTSPTSPTHTAQDTPHRHSPPAPTLKVPLVDQASRHSILNAPRSHQTFRYHAQPSSRLNSHQVGYAEYGAKAGWPVFMIGGHGCTRLVGVMFDDLACRYGIRMIWPERPGYGLSDECNVQHLSALAWTEVVIQLADHLNIPHFGLIAQSVGSVFALALAYKYPLRVVGPVFLISPWVSTQAANTFKWARRLPAGLVTRTLSIAMDVMWMFSKTTAAKDTDAFHATPTPSQSSPSGKTSSPARKGSFALDSSTPTTTTNNSHDPTIHTLTALEEDELLASLEDQREFSTDFPPHRPLRHVVRPKHVSLYLAMNRQRMEEPCSQGQLGDVLVALEKYHGFGFSYSEVRTGVSAVWGDKDGLISQKGIDILANTLNDLRLKILDGEGHDLVWKEGVMEWAIRGIAERRKERVYH